MPNSINRSKIDVNRLAQLYYQMEDGQHVEAGRSSVYGKSGASSVQHAGLQHWNDWRTAESFAKGYDAVKQAVVRSVGKPQAEHIMQKILGKKGRSQGWKSCWKPRQTAITKQQLKKIVDATYDALAKQMPRQDVKKRRRMLQKMYPNAANIRAIEDGKEYFMDLCDVMRDPELKEFIHSYSTMEHSEESFDFLQECEHYDSLVSHAERLEQSLIHEGLIGRDGELQDNDNTPVDVNNNGQLIRRNDNLPPTHKGLIQYHAALNKVKLKARSLQKNYVNEGINIAGKVGQTIMECDVANASITKLKQLFGEKPTSQTNKKSPNKSTGARQEIYSLLHDTYRRARAYLTPTTKSVAIVNRGQPTAQFDVTVDNLRDIHGEMGKKDQLRMLGGRDAILYSKTKFSLKEKIHWHTRFVRDHGSPHWYEGITAFFSKNARSAKFNRAKVAVRDALASHFNDKQIANKIMNRLRSRKGMTAADLYEVLTYADFKKDIDDGLQSLADDNDHSLGEINAKKPTDLWKAWKNDDRDSISKMIEKHSQIQAPGIKNSADKIKSLMSKLRILSSGRKDLRRNDLTSAQDDAKFVLKCSSGLSRAARNYLKAFIKLDPKKYSQRDFLLVNNLANELEKCGLKLAGKALAAFRNDRSISNFISQHFLDEAINRTTDSDINRMNHKTLLDPNGNTSLAFRTYCQFKGQNESLAVRLANYSDSLQYLFDNWDDNGQNRMKIIREEIQEETKSLLRSGVKFHDAHDGQKPVVGKRTPMQILQRLAEGKIDTPNDLMELSKAIDDSLNKDINEFKKFAASQRQQNVNLANNNNSSGNDQINASVGGNHNNVDNNNQSERPRSTNTQSSKKIYSPNGNDVQEEDT